MSRHQHAVATNDISHLVYDIQQLSYDEIERLYGIKIMEDGKVFDSAYNQEFESLANWVTELFESEEMELEGDFSSGKNILKDL